MNQSIPPRRVRPAAASSAVGETLLARLRHERLPAARGQPEPERLRDLLAEPATLEIRAHRLAGRALPEVALVERGRRLEQLVEPVALAPLRVGLRRGLLVLELDVEAVGEPLDRADEVQSLELLDEADRVAADAAAEAVVRPAVRRHGEARRLLLVERTETGVAAADLAQPRALLDEHDDVGRALDRFDGGVLDPRHQSVLRVVEREAVGHARDELRDLLFAVAAFGEVLEDPRDDVVSALVLAARVRAEVHVVEHETPKREHRLADLVALRDVPRGLGALDEVVHERVDPLAARVAEQRDLVVRQLLAREDPVADRVVDVVVDVRDAVDDAHDLPFERVGLALAGVREDAVAHLRRSG